MKCAVCESQVNSMEEAIRQSWIPSFFEGNDEHGPVCSSCAELLIFNGVDGSLKLRDEYKGKIVYCEEDDFDTISNEVFTGFPFN